MTKTRAELLSELVNYSRNPSEVVNDLRPFGWDTNQILLVINGGHVRAVLNRFLDGQVSAQEVSQWAECLEGREDLGYENDRGDDANEAIFILANPSINGGPLWPELARGILDYLDGKDNINEIVREHRSSH